MRPRVVGSHYEQWARVVGRMKDARPFIGRAAITSWHDEQLDLKVRCPCRLLKPPCAWLTRRLLWIWRAAVEGEGAIDSCEPISFNLIHPASSNTSRHSASLRPAARGAARPGITG